MLSPRVRLLNFDDSVIRQLDFPGLAAAKTVDLTDLGPAARLWADRTQAAAIRRALDPALKDAITFLGSGDYHYVSAFLLEQFREPVSLIVFDHHPDWDGLPPRHGCCRPNDGSHCSGRCHRCCQRNPRCVPVSPAHSRRRGRSRRGRR